MAGAQPSGRAGHSRYHRHVLAAPWRALGVAVAAQLGRFGVIVLGLALAPLVGIFGWFAGLFVNALCCLYAAALITGSRSWRSIGFLTPWRGWVAALLLLVPFAEALSWVVPDGPVDRPPGYALWALSLLMVGFNEELTSRGFVLGRLGRDFGAGAAVTITAALFGLQHLSLLLTTSRGTVDMLTNVLASACYGFGLAAFQYRFAWITPLILVHALSDFTTLLASNPFGDLVVTLISVIYLAYGGVILWSLRGRAALRRPGAATR